MFTSLRKQAFYGFSFLVLISSCASERRSRWAEELSSQLKCGMSQSEVQEAAKASITTSMKQFLGTHKISKDKTDFWLRFDGDGLRSYLVTRTTGLKGLRVSPRRDLCTGELSFLLRIQPSYELLGAEVYLNGERLSENAWSLPIELPAGGHELRIEKTGYMPFIRRISLETSDSGEIRLDLTDVKLRPIERPIED